MLSPTRSIVATAVAAVLAASCGPGQPEEGAQQPGASPGDTTSPAGPQELVVGASQDNYETQEPEANVGMYPLNVNIFEGLVRMTPDYDVEPVLATEWEFVEPNTFRFHLREGVTFHNGEPFTAEAVKYSFDRIAEAGGGQLRIDENSTKIIDDFTVEVTPTVENHRMVGQLVHPENSILAPGTTPTEEPVGTGPFQFVSYTRAEEIVVERYEDYWDDPARLERITFRFIPEANARRLALQAGDIDVIVDVPLAMAPTLEGGQVEIATAPVGAYEAMYANVSDTSGTILQDERVRKAIEMAIDRQALVEGIFEGVAEVQQTMIPARLLDEHAQRIEGYTYDPEGAAQLLEEAGWTAPDGGIRQKDGQPLRLVLVSGFPNAEEHGAVPEFLQAQLGEVGIDVEIVTTPDTASYEERLQNGQGDLWLERGSQNDANPAFLPALLFWEVGVFGHTNYQPLFAPGWPEGPEDRIGDGSFDEAIEQALATPDPEEAKEKTAEAMHLMIDEHAIVIPLAGIVRVSAHTSRVHGFQPHPSLLQVRYDDVFLTGG